MTVASKVLRIRIPRSLPIREQIYRHLRSKILNGALKPGTRLAEAALGKEIQVSRTPVREALLKLELEGLTHSLPRGGFIVSGPELKDIEEILDLRSLLECHAVRLAATRHTEKDLRALGVLVARAAECIGRKDFQGLYDANSKFHGLLYEATRSARFSKLMMVLMESILRFRKIGLQVPDEAEKSVEGHRKILAALRRGDGDLAARLMAEHIEEARQAIIRAWHDRGLDEAGRAAVQRAPKG